MYFSDMVKCNPYIAHYESIVQIRLLIPVAWKDRDCRRSGLTDYGPTSLPTFSGPFRGNDTGLV